MKQRLLGLALALTLIGTVAGFGSGVRAADTATVTVTASVADVLTLTVDQSSFSFGTGVNFLGQNAARGACALSPGFRYLSPDINATVQSNQAYDVVRTATGSFPVGRLLVRNAAFTSCPDALANGFALGMGPDTIVYGHLPSANGQSTDLFLFDVLVDSPSDSYSATITYTAQVHV